MRIRKRGALLALVAALVATACAPKPEAVHWGVEECTQCQMAIADERYAGQVVDRRGKAHKFDSIECMTAFLSSGRLAGDDIHSIWVAEGRDGWVPAQDAHFVHSEQIRSPMGGGLTAHTTAAAARALHEIVGGEILDWAAVLALPPVPHAHRAGVDGGHSAHDGH
jgi:copper chaperone NosL